MINLFHINDYTINTSKFSNLLHDKIVTEFEEHICDYVGAKYAVSLNSATNAIFLALLNKNTTINIPSILPPVVVNAIVTSNNKYVFNDNIDWVGDSYILHDFGSYKIIDSAQKIEHMQFSKEANDDDLMIFSFYPTKPIGSCDGGIIVSNNKDHIEYLRALSFNGMSFAENNWDRYNKFFGYKMYMNSIQATIALNNLSMYNNKLAKLSIIRNYYNVHLGLNNVSNHLYRITTDDNLKFIKHMKERKILCGIHYKALHEDDLYKNQDYDLPLSSQISRTTVSIPFHEKLREDELSYILESIYQYDT